MFTYDPIDGLGSSLYQLGDITIPRKRSGYIIDVNFIYASIK